MSLGLPLLTGALLSLAPSPSSAPAPDPLPVCWVAPAGLGANQARRLADALKEAGTAARPPSSSQAILLIASKQKQAPPETGGCSAVLKLALGKRAKPGRALALLLESPKGEPLDSYQVVLVPEKVTAADFAPVWQAIWARLAPPPPPPPPPSEAKSLPFIDDELKAEQRALEPAPVLRGPAFVSLLLDAGFSARSLSGAPGTAVGSSGLLSLGIMGTAHVDALLGLTGPHRLDLSLGYRRRLARGVLGEEKVGIDADRFDVEGAWRYALGDRLPAVGALAGFELLRFEIDPLAQATSTRYGVLRLGLTARQGLIDDLGLFFDGALRLSPGAEGGSAGPGFDLGGGLGLSLLDQRLLVRAGVRFTRQSADIGGAELGDSYLDLDLGVGVAL